MTQKKYIDIERCKEAYANKFIVGEYVKTFKIISKNHLIVYQLLFPCWKRLVNDLVVRRLDCGCCAY